MVKNVRNSWQKVEDAGRILINIDQKFVKNVQKLANIGQKQSLVIRKWSQKLIQIYRKCSMVVKKWSKVVKFWLNFGKSSLTIVKNDFLI
jgi:hypothetical protein